MKPELQTALTAALIAAAFLTGLATLYTPYTPDWDEHVYIHEARWLQTGGEHGLLEDLRPLGYPVVLAATGATTNTAAHTAGLTIAVLTAAAFAATATRLTDHHVGLASTAALLTLPVIADAFAGTRPATLALGLASLSAYAYTKQHWGWHLASGAAAAYAAHTRHVYAAWVLAGLAVHAYNAWTTEEWRDAAAYTTGAALTTTAFSTLYYALYAAKASTAGYPAVFGAVWPWITQIIDHTGSYAWLHAHPWWWYAAELSAITPFFVAAATYKPDWDNATAYVATATLVIAAFLTISPHKELRYIIPVAAWLLLAATNGLTKALSQKLPRRLAATAALLAVLATTVPGLAGHIGDRADYYERRSAAYHETNPLPFNASDRVLLATPEIQSDARLTIAYENHSMFHDKLTARGWDGVVYDPEAFPCQDNDQACKNTKHGIERHLRRAYQLASNTSYAQVYTQG